MKPLEIGFIGLGLIGGSIAKAIRKVHPEYIITAYDPDVESLNLAFNEKVVNITCMVIDESFSNSDIIFLCAPVKYNIENLKILKDIINDNCIITDVGSVKGDIHKAVDSLGLTKYFIGGHPMTGSERVGYKSSNYLLMENAYYMITKTDVTTNLQLDFICKFIKDIGSIVLVIDYNEHDYITAAISHLPHIAASGLVNVVKDSGDKKELMKSLAAGGFKDITRIASSSPTMWQQILFSNSYYIKKVLKQYIDNLTEILDAITLDNSKEVYSFFDLAREFREQLPSTAPGVLNKIFAFYVDIPDESGVIANISGILAKENINIKNIGIIHNREYEDGVLKIEFYDENSMCLSQNILLKKNYTLYLKQ